MTSISVPVSSARFPPSLPGWARYPINRCNLPAVILGGETFQAHPVALEIDGVRQLHRQLFEALGGIDDAGKRALHFGQYMASAFLLGKRELAGFDSNSRYMRRDRADYLRLLRGWMFNPDGIEAAVLKRWVESRFGLLVRYHNGLLQGSGPWQGPGGASRESFDRDVSRGLYNANALEAQLDLLYTFCQYELGRRWPGQQHRVLFRGVNQMADHDVLGRDGEHLRLLLNNLNSFSSDAEHACAFGDQVLEVRVPLAKVMFFPGLLPGVLRGEQEYLVIGGVYRVTLV